MSSEPATRSTRHKPHILRGQDDLQSRPLQHERGYGISRQFASWAILARPRPADPARNGATPRPRALIDEPRWADGLKVALPRTRASVGGQRAGLRMEQEAVPCARWEMSAMRQPLIWVAVPLMLIGAVLPASC